MQLDTMIMMATTHTELNRGDLGKVVLMPGDPVRAKYIAEHFLTNVEIKSHVRGITAYVGYTKNNKRVAVMASGMGQPSIGIYSHELYKDVGVELIIRVGTAGSFNPSIHVRDVLVASASHTRSNFAYQLDRKDIHDCAADSDAVNAAIEVAAELNKEVHVGTIYTNDAFYGETDRMVKIWATKGYIGVEMEAFALYYTAKKLNKRALCLLTVSDHFYNKEAHLTQEEKVQTMDQMMLLALGVAERFA